LKQQKIIHKIGDGLKFTFSVPSGIERILFCIKEHALSLRAYLEQVISNPDRQSVVMEVDILPTGTSTMRPGDYVWYIYAIRSDGSRDITFPLSEGEISFVDQMDKQLYPPKHINDVLPDVFSAIKLP